MMNLLNSDEEDFNEEDSSKPYDQEPEIEPLVIICIFLICWKIEIINSYQNDKW